MNYTELKQAIQDYCQNSETTFVSNIDNFIRATEDKVFMAITMPAFWKSDLDQNCVADQAEYTLDEGVIDIFSTRIGETAGAQASGVEKGPVRYLLKKDYDFLLEAYPGDSSDASTGIPKYYAISSAGESSGKPTLTIRLGPIPNAAYPMTVDYYGKVAADGISSSNTDTWLSVTAPDVLLYGSLVHAYIFMKGEADLIQAYDAKFNEGVILLKNLGEARQSHDSYTSGAPRPPVQ